MPKGQKRKTSLRKRSRTPYYVAVFVVVFAVAIIGLYLYTRPIPCTTPNVLVNINTTKGSMEVKLFSCSAPKTVANFVSLAKSGFYNNLVWHRIATNPSVIQTGDPNTRNGGGNRSKWGTGGSNKTVPLEVSNSSLHNTAGFLGMARGSDVNSGSSQFYINIGSNTGLDGSYTVFGEVISGMSVANAIAGVQTYTNSSSPYYQQPVDPSQAMLISITIISGG